MREFSEAKYKQTPLKKLALILVKLMELYPSSYQQMIMQLLIDHIPHKHIAVDSQYLYFKMVMDVARLMPAAEERIVETLVDRLCQIDVDIKATKT